MDEGPLVVLGDIRFTGNDHYKDPANFQQYIIGQTRERFPASRKDLPYVDTDVQKGTDLVQRFYLSEGYLEAQVGTPTVEFVNGRTRANLTIPIVEGARYRFGDVSIDGELVFPPERGARPHRRPDSAALHPAAGRCMQRRLEDYYKKKGYFTAQVTARATRSRAGRRTAACRRRSRSSRGRCIISTACASSGTDRLKPEYLRNRFRELSGKVYDPKALDELYQEMIRTGLFAQLKVDAVPQAGRHAAAGHRRQGSEGARVRRFSSATGRSRAPSSAWNCATAISSAPGGRSVFRWIIPRARSAANCSTSIRTCSRPTTNCECALDAMTRDLDSYKKNENRRPAPADRADHARSSRSAGFAQVDQVKITDASTCRNSTLGQAENYTADVARRHR